MNAFLLAPPLILYSETFTLQELPLPAVGIQPLFLHLQKVALPQQSLPLLPLPKEADALAFRTAVAVSLAVS